MDKNQSKYWLDVVANEILGQFPDRPIKLSSGISPSASYHIGHFREIMTAEALVWAIKQHGGKAEHIHVVDNFDPLRKKYEFLPDEFEEYVGQPVAVIKDPFEECRASHHTYAEHFYKEFEYYSGAMGIHPAHVKRSYEDLYSKGEMAQAFEDVALKLDFIRQVFEEVSNRKLPQDWTPIQVLGKDNKFYNARKGDIDIKKRLVDGRDYTRGEAKLNWRLDWPARWRALEIDVEPFSAQEHGAAGGSYETGAIFSKEVFGYKPPLPGVQYANIHMSGDTKKMSSSKGNFVTPKEALEIMPPEVLRYFVVRSRPEKVLQFDPGVGLLKLLDEYSGVKNDVQNGLETDFAEAYLFASQVNQDILDAETIPTIPFSHLTQVYQAAQGDSETAQALLKRTGYDTTKTGEFSVVEEKFFPYVRNWLEKYAPDEVKFKVQGQVPDVPLSADQRDFLKKLAAILSLRPGLDGHGMHEAIYEAKEATGVTPKHAFEAIYQVILGKSSGPKAGWFLASLDLEWLIKRLKLEA